MKPADRQLFLITGATGKTGRHAVRLLVQRGFRVRALVHREDDRSRLLTEAGAEVVIGDLLDMPTVRAALDGVNRAYFTYPIRPHLLEATAVFAQAAHDVRSVDAVVNMSQVSARPDAVSNAARQHWLAERWLDWTPLRVTHLRPTFFAEWLTQFGVYNEHEGVLALPLGDGRHAPIAAEDQAHVIAAILADPEPHAGRVYPLFGPVEMHHDEIAAAMSLALGRPVRYEPITVAAFAEKLRASGAGEHLIQHLSNVAIDYQNGIFAGTNDVVETVGGKSPMTVEHFVAANRREFAVKAR
ncbi:NmrA family transcriptional regulator [Mycolicibacterium agri]|uniref:NmrA family transcriptional regulator n=1 Tax=Mycolicibacterium agri TaxID=36811 RepID=A0A2A7N3W2_MYCAG|nr:NmrA family NAD(P)-binding protein [Mycolicibacterium agri]PEG38584.1 NmrA family transcriptional regulator [Mycolicibacterium agri]GFG53548.1 NmrA family transcriptional regulator [Mycolicibacterium agri]